MPCTPARLQPPLARSFVPRLAAGIRWERSSNRILGRFQGSLMVGFDRILQLRDGDSHILGKCCTRLIELHDFASSATFAMPGNFTRGPSVHRGMEVCCSTSLLSRCLSCPTHWQNDFHMRRMHDHQLREALLPSGTSRANCWVIAHSPSNRIRAKGCLRRPVQ